MRKLLSCGTLYASLLLTPYVLAEKEITSVKDLRWDHRVILMRAGKQEKLWQHHLSTMDAGIRERHIVWFLFSGDEVSSNLAGRLPGHKISREFSLKTQKAFFSGAEKVVLIGKDGFIKEQELDLDLKALFGAIDVMPMRQAEMGAEWVE